ncbi:hypothetical protein KAW18_03025 [candidate division WOR-3 bacterium]|nr:hypothetical protein [candidate division WOR-3 bacterium]
MKEEIKLSKDDREKLAELYQKAQTTPVIFVGGCEDMVTIAWNSVRKFMDKLGEKYDFDPSIYSINTETGEVKKYSEIDFKEIEK